MLECLVWEQRKRNENSENRRRSTAADMVAGCRTGRRSSDRSPGDRSDEEFKDRRHKRHESSAEECRHGVGAGQSKVANAREGTRLRLGALGPGLAHGFI